MVYDGIIGIKKNVLYDERVREKKGFSFFIIIPTDNMQMYASTDFRLGRDLTLVKPSITRLL